jgi:hypothetical protein
MSAPATHSDELSWDEELRAAEAAVIRRLRQLIAADDSKIALRACETLSKLLTRARRERVRATPPRPRTEPTPPVSTRPDPRVERLVRRTANPAPAVTWTGPAAPLG